jgi:hypothetical protein
MKRLLILGLALIVPSMAFAGMPSYNLSDLGRVRLGTLSFFLLLLLLCAWGVKGLWNLLRRDFAWMPYLDYRRSLGLMALWGLLFLLVLTMISGAREIMTPGAWVKRGVTYALADETMTPMDVARRQRLELLRIALWSYADRNQGRFPPHDLIPEIAADTWSTLDPSGVRFLYLAGVPRDAGAVPLAYEPGVYGSSRFVLFADGDIRRLPLTEITAAIQRFAETATKSEAKRP